VQNIAAIVELVQLTKSGFRPLLTTLSAFLSKPGLENFLPAWLLVHFWLYSLLVAIFKISAICHAEQVKNS
jgi:hypothetical protein